MSKQYLLSIDQGTTGSTVAIIDLNGKWIGSSGFDFRQIFPNSGWVEHDPAEIWNSVLKAIEDVLKNTGIGANQIASIGVTNQRETVVAWDLDSGDAVYNAIVWQCRRTSDFCLKLREDKSIVRKIKIKTGLVIDPYFSASKINWILKNVSKAKFLEKQGRLKVGTIDSYLLWKLTGGESHKTEISNASRTMLMELKTAKWDDELLKLFRIPRGILPTIVESSTLFGKTRGLGVLPNGIPITGILGDQQSALFGQTCFKSGQVKCTYGTGSFILMNTGSDLIYSKHGMLTTAAWMIGNKPTYAIEGGAYICGAAVQWLRDSLGFFESSAEVEQLASKVTDTGGVEFIPALTGLGAPYWKPEARGVITGLTRGTNRSHLARATLEAMALQNVDIISAMEKDIGKVIRSINVDGGASSNDLLMQMQADFMGKKVLRPQIVETTALGAALMAGLGAGVWKNAGEIKKLWDLDREFLPVLKEKKRKLRIDSWHATIEKVI